MLSGCVGDWRALQSRGYSDNQHRLNNSALSPDTKELRLRAIYLTGEMVYLRAFVLDDKERAIAWFPGPFPVNATRAEEWLKETHKNPWGRIKHYAICRVNGDDIVGSTKVWHDFRHAMVTFDMAPLVEDADTLRADAIGIMTRWLRDEGEHLTVTFALASDEHASIAAAESVGCIETARFREHIARPGCRVDKLFFQALNPRWRIVDEAEEDASGAS